MGVGFVNLCRTLETTNGNETSEVTLTVTLQTLSAGGLAAGHAREVVVEVDSGLGYKGHPWFERTSPLATPVVRCLTCVSF